MHLLHILNTNKWVGVAVKDDERRWGGGGGVSTTWMMSLIIRLIRMYVMMVYVLFT